MDISVGNRVAFTDIHQKDKTLELSNVAKIRPSLKYRYLYLYKTYLGVIQFSHTLSCKDLERYSRPRDFQLVFIIKLLEIDIGPPSLENNDPIN